MQCCAHIHAGTQYVVLHIKSYSILIQRCMHIISRSNADHDILDTNHANLIFNVLKYKDSIIYVLWYEHDLF